ncbi:Fungal Zn(2)-Cys(6) binuclear cluster domain [Rhizoctonia solani]|uniref:Fungal Zn(2)-Cys(6) binuclear cluster domain n=1 Tax=Rhizoctonia solani TaxID=456999 RepID=A0A8H8T045_9AGAM|nr:Fungal Zn(2)-Cys(6) binuclear cluster domain [Rhizoctonia solani]QRW25001.1 Fungal Zn(2)-Cys(6) binuclear cluster domain [Rhizoctonia solani]
MEAHLFVPALIAGAAARKEKHRTVLRKKILASEHRCADTRGADFVFVLDHLWHGAAVGGSPVTWEDYVTSRYAVMPLDVEKVQKTGSDLTYGWGLVSTKYGGIALAFQLHALRPSVIVDHGTAYIPSDPVPNRSSKGCLTCRQRKKKCDERKPECERCALGGFNCLGYSHLSGSKVLLSKHRDNDATHSAGTSSPLFTQNEPASKYSPEQDSSSYSSDQVCWPTTAPENIFSGSPTLDGVGFWQQEQSNTSIYEPKRIPIIRNWTRSISTV